MVECESRSHNSALYSDGVLIDTWWNVNIDGTNKSLESVSVLIDTWWNVNYLWSINFRLIT